MDQKTRRERARNKQLARKTSSGLSSYIAPRGLAVRGKIEKFPNRQCDYRIGGKEQLIRRKRENPKMGQPATYMIPLVVGGQRCVKNELTNGRCLEHLGATYAKDEQEKDEKN
jgi:hypothetical protein